MTNQMPAPKASGATASLVSLTINSRKTDFPGPVSKLPGLADEDFSSVILHALSSGSDAKPVLGKNGATLAKQQTQVQENTANPDPAGLLLPLLLQTAPPPPQVSTKQKFTGQPDTISSNGDAKLAPEIDSHQTSPLAEGHLSFWNGSANPAISISSPRALVLSRFSDRGSGVGEINTAQKLVCGPLEKPVTIPNIRGLPLVGNAPLETSDTAKPGAAASPNDLQSSLKVLTRPPLQEIQPIVVSVGPRDKDGVLAKAALLWKPAADQDETLTSDTSDETAATPPLQTAVPISASDGVKLSSNWVASVPTVATFPKASIRSAGPVSAGIDSKRPHGPDPQQGIIPTASKSEPPPQPVKNPIRPDARAQGPLPDGTSAAISEQRMNFVAQKNEYAGSAEQNLPLAEAASIPLSDTATDADRKGAATSLDFFWRDTSPEMISMVNLSAKPAETGGTVPISSPVAATPATRLEQMISHEAVAIRQTGAQSLGVSLKLNDNTHLFLQLTTHNGTIQASLRCEKGDFSALDSQWTQLQTSLARQNIELLPIAAATQSNFQHTSQQQQQQRQFQQQEDAQPANLGVPPTPSRQQKNPNARRSRPDRQFWA